MMTVREVADLTGVTIKTLHHYHKIGLLNPSARSKAGYRLYEKEELKLLQEILFYKELDIPLKEIKKLIQENKSRKEVLKQQRYFMQEKQKHLDSISLKIDEAIEAEVTGNEIDEETMFQGITISQWIKHLEEHSDEIKEKSGVDISEIDIEDPDLLQAIKDVESFISKVEKLMALNTSLNDQELQQAIHDFLTYWNKNHEEQLTIDDMLEKSWEFLSDSFQRQILKSNQLGLRSYLYVACLEYKNNYEKVEGEKKV